MKCDLVSVIVPIFNTSQYLEKCLKSIFNQTYDNIEIILIDDGSTDGSQMICQEYKKKYANLIYQRIENSGPVIARKTGMAFSHGDYIAFVDSDDFVDSDFIETLYNNICLTKADFVHSGFRYVNEGGVTWDEANFNNFVRTFENKEQRESFIEKYLLDYSNENKLSFSIWSKLFRRDFIIECFSHVPDYLSLGEDGICFVYAITCCKVFSSLREVKYNYYVRKKSLSHSIDKTHVINNCHFLHELDKACEECGYKKLKWITAKYFVYNYFVQLKLCGFILNEYSFPMKKILYDKKIVLYGAGAVGKDYYSELTREKNIYIVGVLDKNWENIKNQEFEVIAPSEHKKLVFDYMIIAVCSDSAADSIRTELLSIGVDDKKIIYFKPIRGLDCLNNIE